MLAMASRLFLGFGKSAAMYPALTVFKLMDEAAPRYISELECHPILTSHELFIPDVQVDMGIGWSPDPLECNHLLQLLQYRRKNGLKTFLGVQNLAKLSPILAAYLSKPGRFEHLYVGHFPCPEHPEPKDMPVSVYPPAEESR